ncbi:hypothetical protein AVEN_32971-1 [Araneus ventricosus]|uniref:Mutator-like transposase domain-containing protein n=1 Tax=Araneus ventricosus TaxID=182803 RepID=A0A4Y2INC8_ARAVE|nr:hypothetical protein AVEN_32971-1 [Araneus ventricosus]
MPRSKRKSDTGRKNVHKRWRPKVEVNASSNSSQNTNLRCLNLEESCNNSIISEGKYKDESKSPTYVIIDTNVFTDLFKNHMCNTCKNSSLRVVFGRAYGFCQDLKVVCDFCDKVINEVETSKQIIKNENGLNQPFDINLRATQAFLSFGRGYTALEKFCMFLNMRLMSSRTLMYIR